MQSRWALLAMLATKVECASSLLCTSTLFALLIAIWQLGLLLETNELRWWLIFLRRFSLKFPALTESRLMHGMTSISLLETWTSDSFVLMSSISTRFSNLHNLFQSTTNSILLCTSIIVSPTMWSSQSTFYRPIKEVNSTTTSMSTKMTNAPLSQTEFCSNQTLNAKQLTTSTHLLINNLEVTTDL